MTINNVSIDGVPSLAIDTEDENYFYSLIPVPSQLITPTVVKEYTVPQLPGSTEPPITYSYTFNLQLAKTTLVSPGWPTNSHVYTICMVDDKIAFYYVTNPATSLRLIKQGDVVNGCTIGKVANYYATDELLLCVAEVGGSANFTQNQTYSVNNDSTLQITVKAGRGIRDQAAIVGVFATDYKTIEYTSSYNRPDVQAEAEQTATNRYTFGIIQSFDADYSTSSKIEPDLFTFPQFDTTDPFATISQYDSGFTLERTPEELSEDIYRQRTVVNQSWLDDFNTSVLQSSRSAKTSFESNENFTIDKQTPTTDGSDIENKKTITTWREYPQDCGPINYPLFAFNLKNNDTQYALDSDESRPIYFTLLYTPVPPEGTGRLPGISTTTGDPPVTTTSYTYPYTQNFVTVNCNNPSYDAVPATISYYPDGTISTIIAGTNSVFTEDDYQYDLVKKATWRIKTSTDLLPTVNQTFSNPFITGMEFTFLTEDVSSSATTIPVVNTIGFTNCGYIAIPSYEVIIENVGNYDAVNEKRSYKFNGIEYIYYTGLTETSFTGCTRGVFGSAPRTFNKLNSRVLDYQRPPVNQYLPYKIGPVD